MFSDNLERRPDAYIGILYCKTDQQTVQLTANYLSGDSLLSGDFIRSIQHILLQ